MRRRLLSWVLAVMLPLSARAQQTTSDGTRLPLGRDSLVIFLIRGSDTTRTGGISDELRQVADGGVEAVERIYRSNDRLLGRRLDTLVDVRLSLGPLRHQSRTDNGLESVQFNDAGAMGVTRARNGDSAARFAALAATVINASSVDLFLRAATLTAGCTTNIQAYSPTLGRILDVQARVAGVDTVAREASWRVQAEMDGRPVVFWIGTQSRRLNRQILRLHPGISLLFERTAYVAPRAGQRAL